MGWTQVQLESLQGTVLWSVDAFKLCLDVFLVFQIGIICPLLRREFEAVWGVIILFTTLNPNTSCMDSRYMKICNYIPSSSSSLSICNQSPNRQIYQVTIDPWFQIGNCKIQSGEKKPDFNLQSLISWLNSVVVIRHGLTPTRTLWVYIMYIMFVSDSTNVSPLFCFQRPETRAKATFGGLDAATCQVSKMGSSKSLAASVSNG